MKNILIGICFFLSFTGFAQFDHESVFPELEGEALRNALIENYKTSVVLTYSEARDTFFRNIDAVDNVLECVYTGYKISLDPNVDPTTDAFDKGINTEHTYPRSKGALENTNAYSDMHHLFPTRIGVNSDRGTLPFGEIIDSQTDKWYFEDNVVSQIPTQGIDNYSELLTNENFEPREKHKGDVARAYFYFYTMYKSQADQAAPNYFELQQETMCQWHFEDPVDEKEWQRNTKVAAYQEGKKNPFILDCRLARLYCEEIEGTCLTVGTSTAKVPTVFTRPNPVTDRLFIDTENFNFDKYIIYSSEGKQVLKGWLDKNKASTSIEIIGLRNGFFFLQILDENDHILATTKFIKI